MTALVAFFDMLGTVLDRNPLGDMGFPVFAGVSTPQPFFVGPNQARDQMTSIRIDPLIDRFMADLQATFQLKPVGSLLWAKVFPYHPVDLGPFA